MRWWSFACLLAPLSVGCTNLALERHTLKQIDTGTDMRYRDVLENLAMFAAEPYTLPALNAVFSGSTKITDQPQISTPTSVIGRVQVPGGSATFPQSETLSFPEVRQVYGMWTLDPVSSPEKLRAVRACCWRVLYGPEFGPPEDRALLKKYGADMPPGHYFDVDKDLADIDTNHPGWLCQGCLAEVPARACYKACHRGKWVWVMPEGMAGLTRFSLIMAKLARVNTDSYYFPLASTRTLVFTDATPRKGMSVQVTAVLDPHGRLVSGDGAYAEAIKHRLEPVDNQDPTLRATTAAAAAGSSTH